MGLCNRIGASLAPVTDHEQQLGWVLIDRRRPGRIEDAGPAPLRSFATVALTDRLRDRTLIFAAIKRYPLLEFGDEAGAAEQVALSLVTTH